MTLVAPPSPATAGPRADRLYPTLTRVQIDRIAPRGRRRHVEQGEVLAQPGAQAARIFVLVAGRTDALRQRPAEEVVVSSAPGRFTGEASMLSGRPALA